MSEIIKEPISGAMIDLFAGAGGLSCGLEQAGFHPVLANEMVEQFANTYKVNHPTTRVVVGDVRNVDEKELHSLVAEHSRIDLIAGGPPCQGFSVNAPIRSLDDPRNHLFEEYLRIVDEIRPKAVLIENVPGIVSLGKGTVVEQIYKALENMGYKVNHRILFAGHYLRRCSYEESIAFYFHDGLCIRNVRLQQQRRHARNIRFCQQSGSEYRYQ